MDCGEGTQHQILRSRLSINKLESILITHIHGDHCYGLPGLLASAGMAGRQSPLTIIAPTGIEEWISKTIKETALYLPYKLKFQPVETFESYSCGELSITATELSHRVPSFAYCLHQIKEETILNYSKLKAIGIPQGPLWGALKNGRDIKIEGVTYKSTNFVSKVEHARKVVVCGDNDNPGILNEFILGCNVLVHESTYTSDLEKRAKDVGHSYARLVAEFASEYSVPNLILTHFSPRYGAEKSTSPSIEAMRDEAREVYEGNLYLASDYDIYRLDRKGKVSVVSPG